MKTHLLKKEILVSSSLDKVFEFFSDPFNLEKLTPDFLNFKILTPKPIEMKKGLFIDYQIRLYRFPMRWKTEITAWNPPYRFVDEQKKGPYRLWVHEHTFEEVNGMVAIRDKVEYAVWGGKLTQKFFVEKNLKKIFDYRHEVIQKIFK